MKCTANFEFFVLLSFVLVRLAVFCLFVCSFLLLLVLSFVVKLNVLATLVQNPSFKQTCLLLIYRLDCLLTSSSYK